ncbi:tail fiber domain-containing protein [Streptomyces sp. NPDC003691]
MAITAYPFDNQVVTETEFSRMFREFQDSGVVASTDAAGFLVAPGSGLTVTVQAGTAIVRGHMVHSTATETLPLPAAGTSGRVDRVVLRLDPTANTISLAVKQGTAGSSTPPSLTQTDTGTFELSLATVAVGANATTISAGDTTSTRPVVGHRVGTWTTATRPTGPRRGRLGLNTDSSTWEFWTGTAWSPLVSGIDWNNLSGKPPSFVPSAHTHRWADLTDAPASLPPSAHTHDWGQVTGRPTSFAPSAHGHDWDDITGKPSSFVPSSHTHAWSQVSGKPSTFAPSSHSHSSYLESGDTIAWANGSKRVHADSVSGSGTYYAVWVQGDGSFARNTSSQRFKQNIRDISVDPSAVLSLRPRVYDRRPKEDGGDYLKDEFGLIAEEVAEHVPEIVTRDETGQIDALRYDLLGVALLPVVQDQAERIARLESLIKEMTP